MLTLDDIDVGDLLRLTLRNGKVVEGRLCRYYKDARGNWWIQVANPETEPNETGKVFTGRLNRIRSWAIVEKYQGA